MRRLMLTFLALAAAALTLPVHASEAAVREAMKKRFYDELNHRMETFFARQAT